MASRRATTNFGKDVGVPLAGGTESSGPFEAASQASPQEAGATPGGSRLVQRRRTFTQGEAQYPSRYRTWKMEDSEESMGDVEIIINLLADLSPAGIMPLAFGMSGTGFIPGMILLLVFTAAAAYMMFLISKTVELTGKKSFDKIWEEVVGPDTMWVPLFVVVLVCFGCCLAYACFFGDLFAGALPGLGLTFATRTVCLIALGVFPLLPLCMLKDLSALAPTSFGALAFVIYTIIAMFYRWYDGSYAQGGQYHTDATYQSAGDGGHLWACGMESLLLVNGLAVAFLSHYNGCKYYREFVGHVPGKFRNRVVLSFFTCSFLFACSMIFGYLTFGINAEGTILNNYSDVDGIANIARIGMGLANVFSFPLMFSGLREATIGMIKVISPDHAEACDAIVFQNLLSAAMLFVITGIAILVTDASLVVGLVGSLCGSGIIYIIPCFLFDRAWAKFGSTDKGQTELALVRTIGCIGCVLAVAGAWATLVL